MILAAGGLLHVDPGLLVWTVLTFLIVVGILGLTAWKPIVKALDERAEKIHGDIDRAEKLKKEAEETLSSYQAKLEKAKEEAIAIVNEASSDASNLKKKMLDEAQVEIKSLKEQATKDIELSKMKAIEELQTKVVDLSVAIAGQILEKQLRAEDHASFVNAELKRLKDSKL
ncbi:MAG: F0F1 ATP synthase subunit B [Leptospiraceae bacterium]|nr:F0F1 ATP synthase subunit B [Leptospiraceae bacterium]MCP5498602.1 F0F1 ATP synthase subunit B [Leptospiraceae bacterium]